MNKEILKEQIKRHEGEVLEVYADSLGYLTLGVGHLIKDGDAEQGKPAGTPVSQSTVDAYYESDFDKHVDETIHVFESKGGKDFYSLPEAIQHVLVNMTFNLGGSRFGKFNNICDVSNCCVDCDCYQSVFTLEIAQTVFTYCTMYTSHN